MLSKQIESSSLSINKEKAIVDIPRTTHQLHIQSQGLLQLLDWAAITIH